MALKSSDDPRKYASPLTHAGIKHQHSFQNRPSQDQLCFFPIQSTIKSSDMVLDSIPLSTPAEVTPISRCEMLAIRRLLEQALEIQTDLLSRLTRRPSSRALHTEWHEYQMLADQLAYDYGVAMDRYLADLRALTPND